MRETTRLVRVGAAALFVAIALFPATAHAHGEKATTDPEDGERLRRAPSEVSVELTEPPAPDARLVVRDGCGDNVAAAPSVDGQTLSAAIEGGEAGRWKVSYRIVSTVDGHPTSDGWSFTVAGKKDCSEPEPEPEETPSENGAPPDDGAADAPPDDGEDDGGSFPVVPVAAGTVVLVALAFVIRGRSTE